MRTPSVLTLSAVLLSAALAPSANASPATQAPQSAASTRVEMADANVAAPAARANAPAMTQAAPAEKKICKQLPSSYSRVTIRTCLTAKEWKQVDEQSRD